MRAKLFAGNLSYDTTVASLEAAFAQCRGFSHAKVSIELPPEFDPWARLEQSISQAVRLRSQHARAHQLARDFCARRGPPSPVTPTNGCTYGYRADAGADRSCRGRRRRQGDPSHGGAVITPRVHVLLRIKSDRRWQIDMYRSLLGQRLLPGSRWAPSALSSAQTAASISARGCPLAHRLAD